MVQDSNHRFKSWEYCYTAFGNLDSVDYLSLHLAFYLASWGMYRGSCGILWKDYTIHMDAVNIIRKFHSLYEKNGLQWMMFSNNEVVQCAQRLLQ